MLTNFKTIKQRIKRLEQLKAMEEDGTFDLLPKKEVTKLKLEIEKLEKFMGGITHMKRQPAAMFIVDPRKERIAVLRQRNCISRSLRSLIPTAIPMRLIMSSPAMMTRFARSA